MEKRKDCILYENISRKATKLFLWNRRQSGLLFLFPVSFLFINTMQFATFHNTFRHFDTCIYLQLHENKLNPLHIHHYLLYFSFFLAWFLWIKLTKKYNQRPFSCKFCTKYIVQSSLFCSYHLGNKVVQGYFPKYKLYLKKNSRKKFMNGLLCRYENSARLITIIHKTSCGRV